MTFNFLLERVAEPPLIYDGVEFTSLPVAVPGLAEDLLVELYRPETRHWRHYFSIAELQVLKDLLRLDFRFTVVGERAVFPSIKKDAELQPFWREGREVTVAFSYEERSPGHYVAWLAAVLKRPLAAEEFQRRLDVINRYWAN